MSAFWGLNCLFEQNYWAIRWTGRGKEVCLWERAFHFGQKIERSRLQQLRSSLGSSARQRKPDGQTKRENETWEEQLCNFGLGFPVQIEANRVLQIQKAQLLLGGVHSVFLHIIWALSIINPLILRPSSTRLRMSCISYLIYGRSLINWKK